MHEHGRSNSGEGTTQHQAANVRSTDPTAILVYIRKVIRRKCFRIFYLRHLQMVA